MTLDARSYSGSLFRPRPEVFQDSQTLIVATPWGARDSADFAISVMSDFLQAAAQDGEATTPFPRLPQLSPASNNLRIAVQLAQQAVYERYNKDEFLSAAEIFAATKFGEELAWIQIGLPHVILLRNHVPPLSLSQETDLAFEFSKTRKLSPLPGRVLGLHPKLDFVVNHIRFEQGDRIALFSRSLVPQQIYTLPPETINLDSFVEHSSKNDENLPFWIGLWAP